MANTLNLGTNGNWATKDGSLLSYNDENDNFKPLPFNFTRASSATRVNKDGLIEVVTNNKPRIDFLNDSNGALLLEPARTNLITYSEDFTQWTDYNASAVLSQETIYGENAYKIVEDSTLNYHGIYLNNLFTIDGTKYIWSVYVKGGERRYVVLTSRVGISSDNSAIIFDTQDGIWTLDSSNQNQAFFAENVGNGWWRIAVEGSPTSGAYDNFTIASAIDGTIYTDANYQGDGTSGIYVAFAQLEQGSYATSYIPTQGAIATRVAETCNGAGNDQVINSTEGVLYVEMSTLANDGTNRYISLSDGSTSNRVNIFFDNNNKLRGFYNGLSGSITINIDTTVNNKIAFKYKSGDSAFWVNGIEAATRADSLSLVGLNSISFDLGGGSTFYGNVKQIQYYDSVLTDAELINLTTI